jgi:hypothetical protein
MNDNDDLSIKQKSINKNHNGLDEIIHALVPLKNERERFRDV